MSGAQATLLAATGLLAGGIWLLLPRGNGGGRRAGVAVTAVAVALFGYQVARFDAQHWLSEVVFLLLAVTAIASALGAMTMRSPVYAAIWFALMLLATAGLFLYTGAQFLGVATIVVYAGAILVTFLFVLMLAQPEGHAYYDRLSWEALLASCTGAVLVGMLTGAVLAPPAGQGRAGQGAGQDSLAERPLAQDGDRFTAQQREANVLHGEHMAQLGGQLFGRHLIAVEVAGTLLLAALVGAVAMVAQGRGPAVTDKGQPHG